jgi:alpha-L-fucosidase
MTHKSRYSHSGILRLLTTFTALALGSLMQGAIEPLEEYSTGESKEERDLRMAWWREAKFGMFIHWGVYAVPAGKYGEETGHGEWILRNTEMPIAEYKAYADDFTAEHYDPQKWVNIAKGAGMRYIVITSKHHDGFALYPSAVTDWDVADATPYGKDLLGPLVDAARGQGINIGFYYSQAQDWIHLGGAKARMEEGSGWDPVHIGDFDEYLQRIAIPQVVEILTYKPDILWWDTPTWMNRERALPFVELLKTVPGIVTNNRLGLGGDTSTPENFIPVGRIKGDWETCMTLNNHWGYNELDTDWKSGTELIRKLATICGKGGNFLLNVGPRADGSIPQGSIDRLAEIGQWMEIYNESIYGTQASPFTYLSWGTATRKGQCLYLHVFHWPEDGELRVPMDNEVTKAYLLNDPSQTVAFKREGQTIILDLPENAPDESNSVIALEFVGDPVTQPFPMEGATASTSSARDGCGPEHVFDGKPSPGWRLPKGETSGQIIVQLTEPLPIAAVGCGEPDIWPRLKQSYIIEASLDGSWQTLLTGVSKGHGFIAEFEAAITTDTIRITIEGDHQDSLGLTEIQFYRPE